MGTKCPTCGRDDFSSKKGMRSHHKISHGESLKKSVTCESCGDEFEVFPYRIENESKKFCSSECQHEAQKNRVNKVCGYCGDSFESIVSKKQKYCSWDCRNEGIKRRTESSCEWCEKVFEHRKSDDRRFCSVNCTENWFSSEERPTSNGTGEDHWAYSGGDISRWYGPNWKESRRIANNRVSECEEPECNKSKNLQCHHIVPFRYFISDDGDVDYEKANDTENLMMLCPKHHTLMDWKIRQVQRASGYDDENE
jgi:hypothetical protein